MGNTKTTDVSPYETMRVMRARTCRADVPLEPGVGLEVTMAGGLVKVTVETITVVRVDDDVMLELLEESPVGRLEIAVGVVEVTLEGELLADKIRLEVAEGTSTLLKVVLNTVLDVLFDNGIGVIPDDVTLLVSKGSRPELEAIVLLESDGRVDSEKVEPLDIVLIESTGVIVGNILPRLDELLDIVKEVTKDGTAVMILLVELDVDEECKLVKAKDELVVDVIVVDELGELLNSGVPPSLLVEEVVVTLVTMTGNDDDVLTDEFGFSVGTTNVDESGDALRVLSLEDDNEKLVEILDEVSLKSRRELGGGGTKGDAEAGTLGMNADDIRGESEKPGKRLVIDVDKTVLTMDREKLSADVIGLTERLVGGRGIELLEVIDCGREPGSAGVPELKEVETGVTVMLSPCKVLVTTDGNLEAL